MGFNVYAVIRYVTAVCKTIIGKTAWDGPLRSLAQTPHMGVNEDTILHASHSVMPSVFLEKRLYDRVAEATCLGAIWMPKVGETGRERHVSISQTNTGNGSPQSAVQTI